MVKRTDIGADDEAGTGMSDFLGSSEQDIDGAEDHDEVAIPPELRDYWATQAELDVRAVGFSGPRRGGYGHGGVERRPPALGSSGPSRNWTHWTTCRSSVAGAIRCGLPTPIEMARRCAKNASLWQPRRLRATH